jgi:hypothetical protein
MSDRLRQMERLKRVRETRERLDEASVARAAAQLYESEARLMELKEAELVGAREAMRVLEEGEHGEWTMSLALRKAFGLDCERVAKEREERCEGLADAQRALRASRVETEQAVVLHRDVRAALLMEEERRMQTETVDRFLARRRWSLERVRVKSLIEVA